MRQRTLKSVAIGTRHLRALVRTCLLHPHVQTQAAKEALEVGSYPALQGNVRRNVRLARGLFFTSPTLARQVVSFCPSSKKPAKVFDPCCGHGELLLAYAATLKVWPDLIRTLTHWGKHVGGQDLVGALVQEARLRLVLLALSKGARPKGEIDVRSALACLPNFTIGDARKPRSFSYRPDVVITNPPYSASAVGPKCEWGTGKANDAASIIAVCLRHFEEGTQLIAVLPEVLRSGIRYRRWREHISKQVRSLEITPVGRFDEKTDVDVFVASVVKKKRQESGVTWPTFLQSDQGRKLSSLFTASVGAVVPFRLDGKGPWRPYLTASDIGRTPCIGTPERKVRFAGTTVTPPFVAIQRTSSPSDRIRIRSSAVLGAGAIAVENHVIVVTPLSGRESDCKQLVKVLGNPRSAEWFNSHFRCRHIPLSAILSAPVDWFQVANSKRRQLVSDNHFRGPEATSEAAV